MRITESKLRRIIRKTITETFAYDFNSSWQHFKDLAMAEDWDGCGEWLEGYAKERKIPMNVDIERHMIDYASYEFTEALELEEELKAVIDSGEFHIG